jgi:regulator of sigma E protease
VGRPVPEKFMETAQVVGMLILLTLVVYANGNDIMKLF